MIDVSDTFDQAGGLESEFHWSSHMDFALTEQQQTFRDSVASFARKELGAGALERAHTPHFPQDRLDTEEGHGVVAVDGLVVFKP